MWKEIELKRDYWQPICEGDVLEGVLVNIDNSGHFGTEYSIEYDNNLTTKLPSHTILKKLMEEVVIGQKVRITFKGEKDAGKGKNPVQIYKVEVWEK